MDNKNQQSLKTWTKPTMKIYSADIIKGGSKNQSPGESSGYKASGGS